MMNWLIVFCINLWCFWQNSWRSLRGRRVDYVYLELQGTLPEFADEPPWWQRWLVGARQPASLTGLRRQFQRIVDDPHVQGVLLVMRDFTPGWATIESLRDELHALRMRDRRVVVYLVNGDTRSYVAACAADKVLMPPTAYLYLLGIRVEARFLRDTLALVGLEAEVTAVSPYKAGGDMFARSEMSPEHREQLERLIDQRFDSIITTIVADRRLTSARVRTLIDEAPYQASAACAAGLIDGVCYEDELEAYLSQTIPQPPGNPARKLIIQEWQQARHALRVPYSRHQRRHVAVVSIEGVIMPGVSRTLPLPLPIIGGAQAGSDSIIQALRHVERDQRIAALVLHVDSPGGDSFASDLIWREVVRVRQQKPVVVSMGNVAASGGYYVAAGANAIVAQPGTITGSIGVYALRPVASTLLQRLGVNTTVLTRGARTGLLSATEPPSDDEREVMRQTVATTYAEFKQRVGSGRGLAEEALEPVAGGRVWNGRDAQRLGLIDELGGLPVAIRRARQLAQLPIDTRAPVLRITPGRQRERLLPYPFPHEAPVAIDDLLAEITRPRLLAVLPWIVRDL